MALQINALCVNCHACFNVCPQQAIYPKDPHFLVNPNKCTECESDFDVPQCASICDRRRHC